MGPDTRTAFFFGPRDWLSPGSCLPTGGSAGGAAYAVRLWRAGRGMRLRRMVGRRVRVQARCAAFGGLSHMGLARQYVAIEDPDRGGVRQHGLKDKIEAELAA